MELSVDLALWAIPLALWAGVLILVLAPVAETVEVGTTVTPLLAPTVPGVEEPVGTGVTAPPPPGASILLQCNRPGCRRTSVHVHMSALGACRRLWACDLFGMEPTVPKRPEWERAAALGTFGETLVVEHLKAQGHELWNTLDDQQALEFEENGIWYVGHPDGDIQHRTGDSILPGAHNLEMDAQLLFLAQWQTGLTSERHRIAIKGFLPCHAKSLPATLAEKRSPTHYRWQLTVLLVVNRLLTRPGAS